MPQQYKSNHTPRERQDRSLESDAFLHHVVPAAAATRRGRRLKIMWAVSNVCNFSSYCLLLCDRSQWDYSEGWGLAISRFSPMHFLICNRSQRRMQEDRKPYKINHIDGSKKVVKLNHKYFPPKSTDYSIYRVAITRNMGDSSSHTPRSLFFLLFVNMGDLLPFYTILFFLYTVQYKTAIIKI